MNAPDALPGLSGARPRSRRPSSTRSRHGSPRPSRRYRPGRGGAEGRPRRSSSASATPTLSRPAAQTLRYARTAPRGEIKQYDAGHFDFYLGDAFEAARPRPDRVPHPPPRTGTTAGRIQTCTYELRFPARPRAALDPERPRRLRRARSLTNAQLLRPSSQPRPHVTCQDLGVGPGDVVALQADATGSSSSCCCSPPGGSAPPSLRSTRA